MNEYLIVKTYHFIGIDWISTYYLDHIIRYQYKPKRQLEKAKEKIKRFCFFQKQYSLFMTYLKKKLGDNVKQETSDLKIPI